MAKPTMEAATAAGHLTKEIARLTAEREKAELLAQVDTLLTERRGELAAAEATLATLRGQVSEAAATLARHTDDIKAGRRVLVELGFEKDAVERELYVFARRAEEQDKQFALRLRTLVPSEPDMTEAEAGRG